MNLFLFAFALLFNFQSTTTDSLSLVSEIEQVTVFKNQAQIQRKVKADLKAGRTMIVFSQLSQTLVEQSIQLKGSGKFTLLSLTTRNDFTEKVFHRSDIQSLRDRKKEIERSISLQRTSLEVIQSEITMLNSTQEIIKNNKLTTTEIDDLITLYRNNLSELLNKRISANTELLELQKDLENINKQINESTGIERTSYKEIVAEVLLKSPQEIEFILDYQVYSAGWIADYDVRSTDINSPLNITYKAKIFQNTGIDWKNIKFIINSGDPSSNATKPDLSTNYVGYYSPNRNRRSTTTPNITIRRNNEPGVIQGRVIEQSTGEPLIGVNVFIKGTNKGVVTNMDGGFRLPSLENGFYTISINYIGFRSQEIPIRIMNDGIYMEVPIQEERVLGEEIVVMGYSANKVDDSGLFTRTRTQQEAFVEPTIIQNVEVTNQTSFSYEIAIPYSVPSDGKHHTVEIKKEAPETNYTYNATPKLSEYAYLIGDLPNWNSLNLIEGDANIYFDNRFVGTTFLNPLSLEDTLSISLGKDEQIVIEREPLKEFSSKNFFRNRTRENVSYEISIRNTKSKPILITIEDQIPISTNEEIKVSVKELSNGTLDKETGIITWVLEINPNETKELRFGFELEYPKGKRIIY